MNFASFDEDLYGLITEICEQNYSRALDDSEDRNVVIDNLYDSLREFLKDSGVYGS
jgi:hypothetical protein